MWLVTCSYGIIFLSFLSFLHELLAITIWLLFANLLEIHFDPPLHASPLTDTWNEARMVSFDTHYPVFYFPFLLFLCLAVICIRHPRFGQPLGQQFSDGKWKLCEEGNKESEISTDMQSLLWGWWVVSWIISKLIHCLIILCAQLRPPSNDCRHFWYLISGWWNGWGMQINGMWRSRYCSIINRFWFNILPRTKLMLMKVVKPSWKRYHHVGISI